MIEHDPISSPKLRDREGIAAHRFYAGFSLQFVLDCFSSAKLETGAIVLDPWSGSGTTALVAASQGYKAIGFDLNPAMQASSRARLTSGAESSLEGILEVLEFESLNDARSLTATDPLCRWFSFSTVARIRQIQREICGDEALSIEGVSDLSAGQCFDLQALISACRILALDARSSNPTWTRDCEVGVYVRPESLRAAILRQCTSMKNVAVRVTHEAVIGIADSRRLPIDDGSVDFILSSPPYCTRIDYAMSTVINNAVIGGKVWARFDDMRRSLIGSPCITRMETSHIGRFGPTCSALLHSVSDHQSKSSKSYYLPNLLQYFDGLYQSLQEIARVLKDGGEAVLVVQDSYYKEHRIDLATIVTEMLYETLTLTRRIDYRRGRSFAQINPRAAMVAKRPTESALFFASI